MAKSNLQTRLEDAIDYFKSEQDPKTASAYKQSAIELLNDLAEAESRPIEEVYKEIEGMSDVATIEEVTAGEVTTEEADDEKGVTIEIPETESVNELTQALLNMLSETTSGVDKEQVKQIMFESIPEITITRENLSQELVQWINSKVSTKYKGTLPSGQKARGKAVKFTPIMYWLLSDHFAHNNPYLWGKAGTGKTFTFQQIAKVLNYEYIEISCNQYTSELEIKGGQTLEGYQQGKLPRAWEGGSSEYDGAVLVLDELPKLDPNTAGMLNSALARMKTEPMSEASEIEDGRGRKIKRHANVLIGATGNIIMTRENPDYVANFQQDASLQDRFVGSIYQIFDDLNAQRGVMEGGALFIFNFMQRVSNVIRENAWDNFAFVSFRILESLRDTYYLWLDNKLEGNTDKEKYGYKTVVDGVDSFIKIFEPEQRKVIVKEADYDGFVERYNKFHLDQKIDTPEEVKEADQIVAQYNKMMEEKEKLV